MELYHVLNRGVDKREIFLDDRDRIRFIHDLFEFNDTEAAGSTYYSFLNPNKNIRDLRSPDFVQPRKQIVSIHGWCLMGNHYHMLLSEKVDGGITLFIRKLNIGYAKYFNEKHKRVGTLFQGRTKKILINSDGHFFHILNYIHLNPLDFVEEAAHWREQRIKSVGRALSHLNNYRWSSYLDYCGLKNFPSILYTGLFKSIFRNYKQEITSYLKDIEVESIKHIWLE